VTPVSLENITNCGSVATKFLSQHLDGSAVFVALSELFDLRMPKANLLLPDRRYCSLSLAKIGCLSAVFGFQGGIHHDTDLSASAEDRSTKHKHYSWLCSNY